MEYQYKYKDLKERQEKVAEAESKGYRMLHDNFDDPNWKHGDAIIGTMTFTDKPEPVMPVEPVRDPLVELDEIKATLKEKGIL